MIALLFAFTGILLFIAREEVAEILANAWSRLSR